MLRSRLHINLRKPKAWRHARLLAVKLSCLRQWFNVRHLVLICIDCADCLRVKDMHNCVSQECLLDDAAVLAVPLLEGVHYFVYVNGTWNIISNNEQGSAT